MTPAAGPAWMMEFDVVGVSVGGALVSGALAIFGPVLGGLTVSLAALAWAGRSASLRAEGGPLRSAVRNFGGGALLATALGLAIYGLAPPVLVRIRGLALAISLLPLWWAARRPAPGGP
jgi:hypothetical protein